MFPFPAALISKEPDFGFLVPKKTVEHFRVVCKCVRFPAKRQLWGSCLPPRLDGALRIGVEVRGQCSRPESYLTPSLLPTREVSGCFLKGVLAAECLSQLRAVLRFNWGNRRKQEYLGTKIKNRNLVLISCVRTCTMPHLYPWKFPVWHRVSRRGLEDMALVPKGASPTIVMCTH